MPDDEAVTAQKFDTVVRKGNDKRTVSQVQGAEFAVVFILQCGNAQGFREGADAGVVISRTEEGFTAAVDKNRLVLVFDKRAPSTHGVDEMVLAIGDDVTRPVDVAAFHAIADEAAHDRAVVACTELRADKDPHDSAPVEVAYVTAIFSQTVFVGIHVIRRRVEENLSFFVDGDLLAGIKLDEGNTLAEGCQDVLVDRRQDCVA